MDVSIIIPIYNARNIIKDSVSEIIHVMSPLGLDYEILLRDDGSTDGSQAVLEQVMSRYSQAKCFYNLSNEGLGSTLRKLFNEARGKNIVYCDCDLPYRGEVIPVLLNRLECYDVVVASRYCGASNRTRLTRKVCSRFYYLLCKLLFSIPVADIGSGSVAMRKNVLDALDLKAKGFDIHAEFYIKASKKEFRIKEIPVETSASMRGSFCVWTHGPRVLAETIKLRFKLFDEVL